MIKKEEKIAVIGAGSWGTALAIHLAKKQYDVRLWGHRAEHVRELSKVRENISYLPGIIFPDNLYVHGTIREAVDGANVVCMVVPSHCFRQVFLDTLVHTCEGTIFVSASKGIENETLKTMTQVMEECTPEEKENFRAVLSGPSFAKEVANEVPTAITIGCSNKKISKYLQDLFTYEYFRAYTSEDIIGLEISASLKNIIAIAAGICDGLAFGSNARAALITRGLAEMTRLGTALGADSRTFYGLSGLGDLVLTCTGDLSRNRYVGLELGKGKKLREILNSMSMVAEGIKTTKSVHDLVKGMAIDMPILEQVYKIIYEEKDCRTAVKDLLNRELKEE